MRHSLLFLSLLIILGATSACSGDSDNGQNPEPGQQNEQDQSAPTDGSDQTGSDQTQGEQQNQGEPVPTPPPHGENQEPAFPEQTRAPEVDSDVTLATREVVTGLEHPWAVHFMPDDRMLLTIKGGNLHIVTRQGEMSEPIEGVPEVDSRDQGGLLDVTLSPNFPDERWVYISYAERRENGETNTAVARGRLSQDETRLEDVEVIFRQQPSWESTKHYGSRFVWDENDEALFVTLGERSLEEPRQLAQDLDAHIGKVVRIKPDGSVPEDNPFAEGEQALPEIWSYGHRNIQGAALHPETGNLWVIEHGPQGGDEINVAEPGKNYGWPVITYGEAYSGEPIGEGITKKEGMEQPIYYWDPVIAPGGAIFYQGDMFTEWQGNLLVSSLSPGALVRLELDGQRVTGEERLLRDIGRVRDVVEGPDGELWVITDEENGRLLEVTRQE